jgi:phosphocarrier protein HPr
VIRSVTVGFPAGLHARAAALVARAAAAQPVPVTVRAPNRPPVPADSVLSLLTLGATRGTRLTVEAEDPAALDAVARLIAEGREAGGRD